MSRLAVVLFNLGGPDGPGDVRPFLKNLFSDPAIIGLPGFLRIPLAHLIASRRETSAQANYALMGGGGGYASTEGVGSTFTFTLPVFATWHENQTRASSGPAIENHGYVER